MPVAHRANGASFDDLDGHRIIDYWQGHYANLLGHNPPLIREALLEALNDGRGLQSGLLHEIEADVAERLVRATGTEVARLTTSGTLASFYAALMSRAFTGRALILKASGAWHGSQPFGLKGITARGGTFDHVESEGLPTSAGADVRLTRFGDVEDLRRAFAEDGERIACVLVEPVLGAGGGIAASPEYLREARRLTEHHGALLICDEIITGFRYRAGSLVAAYGVRADVVLVGKIAGGGMPLAAACGRREIFALASRGSGRVKFEGGTYSAHELTLVASRALLRHLEQQGDVLYGALSAAGDRLRAGIAEAAKDWNVPVAILGAAGAPVLPGSLVLIHVLHESGPTPKDPEELARRRHPAIDDRLLKSIMILEGVSTRSGGGAISTAHDAGDLSRTIEGYRAAFARLRGAGLV